MTLPAGDIDLVHNFVKKLRAKLGEDAARPTWIFNERGVGYRMPRPGEPHTLTQRHGDGNSVPERPRTIYTLDPLQALVDAGQEHQ